MDIQFDIARKLGASVLKKPFKRADLLQTITNAADHCGEPAEAHLEVRPLP
jgi:hypothetical protein